MCEADLSYLYKQRHVETCISLPTSDNFISLVSYSKSKASSCTVRPEIGKTCSLFISYSLYFSLIEVKIHVQRVY